MSTKIRRWINEESGFFCCDQPDHSDVEKYFTEENFIYMFSDGELPDRFTWAKIQTAAHEIINERGEKGT